MSDDSIRAFIAIPIDPDTAPEAYEFLLTRRRQLLSGSWAKRVRWVEPEQFHLTLRFLGQIPGKEIPAIGDRLEKEVADIPCFSLIINKPCLFPRPSRARSVACPVGHRSELKQLVRRVDTACDPLFPDKGENSPSGARPYRAHVTLGRISPSGAAKAPNFPSFHGEVELPVEVVDIVSSQLTEEGASHETLHRIQL